MSIASEITRLQQAKADIKTAIEDKGVTVPSDAKLDDYANLVDSISGGGGSVDWESIARGMINADIDFSIPSSMEINTSLPYLFYGRRIINCDISDGNTKVAVNAFARTPVLSKVTFPSTLTEIANDGFLSSSIVSITLPATITLYGSGVFYGCRSLQEVVMEATTPPTIGTSVFSACQNLTAIYVPDASVSAYQSATNWTTYASKIKGISERPTT